MYILDKSIWILPFQLSAVNRQHSFKAESGVFMLIKSRITSAVPMFSESKYWQCDLKITCLYMRKRRQISEMRAIIENSLCVVIVVHGIAFLISTWCVSSCSTNIEWELFSSIATCLAIFSINMKCVWFSTIV